MRDIRFVAARAERRALQLVALASLGLALAALACASAAPAPAPGRSTAWGYLSIMPRDGASPSKGAAYGDRRLRDVKLVDYSRPGFAVVYTEGGPPVREAAGESRLSIRTGGVGTRLEPAELAVGVGERIHVRNTSDELHVLSCPACGIVQPLAAGSSEWIEIGVAGEYGLFLLDVPAATSTVFAAPGTHSVVSASGRFELTDLAPGRHRIHAWHRRLPPTSRWIELEANAVSRLDLELGVGRDAKDGADVE